MTPQRMVACALLAFLLVGVSAYAIAAAGIGAAPRRSTDHFTLAGDVCCLRPGVWRSIVVTLTNRNGYAIHVNQLTTRVSSNPPGCDASSNTRILQSPISRSHTVTVRARSFASLAPRDQPQIELINLPANQDACKNQTFGLRYAARATA